MRFFPTSAGAVTDAAVAAGQRAYQWGSVLPSTTGTGDLEGDGIHNGMAFFSDTNALVPNAEGALISYSATSVATFGYRENLNLARFGARPTYRWRWAHQDSDNQRVFVGLSSTNLLNANVGVDDPVAAYLALQQRSGETNWFFISRPSAAGSITRVDTEVAIGVALHDWEIIYDSPTSATVILRDVDGDTVFTQTLTSGIPAASELCTPTWGLSNLSGTATWLTAYMNGQMRGSIQ